MSWGKKVLLVILDGLADRPSLTLKGKTPLEAAHTPHLDRLAQQGVNGLFHALSLGVPLPTDVAHYLMFGYPLEERPGRSVFEAMGYGVPFSEEEVLLSTSFARVVPREGAFQVVERQELGLSPQEGRRLIEILNEYPQNGNHGVELELIHTTRHFGILKLKGKDVEISDRITDSDPFYTDLPIVAVQPLDRTEAARRTAEALNGYLRWTYTVLSRRKEKVNILTTKWAGRRIPLEPFEERYGMRGLSISPKELLNGLARYLGLDGLNTRTLDPAGSLSTALARAFRALEEGYDFVHVHDPRLDEISHTKDPEAKVRLIEELDRELEVLVEGLRDDWVVAVTSDHPTPSTPGVGRAMHCGEPVPIVIVGQHVLPDDISAFSEREARQGGLGRIYGKDLMAVLMNYADRLGNYGLRPRVSPKDGIVYRPRRVTPLELPEGLSD